ncbi:MAG: DUF433 domain-containing protein [Gemmataceae bacterium]
MQLQDYFEVDTHHFEEVGLVEKIRFKGSRIAIEDVIEPFVQGESAERIHHGYRHSLSLEEVYAAITYYLHNKQSIDEYLRRGNEVAEFWYQKFKAQEPKELMERLRALKAEKQAQTAK